MAYPTDLPTTGTLPTEVTGNTIVASETNVERSAIIALATKVGVTSSAAASTLDYKLNRKTVYLDDYCAGDGTTDDTTAFQTAVNLMGDGWTCVATAGKQYLITGLVTFPNKGALSFRSAGGFGFNPGTGTTVAAVGAVVLVSGASAGILFSSAGAVSALQHQGPTIENMTFIEQRPLSSFKTGVSVSRTANVVTATGPGTSAGNGSYTIGDVVWFGGAAGNTFSGHAFTVLASPAPTTNTISWSQVAANNTDTGGDSRKAPQSTLCEIRGYTRWYVKRCSFAFGLIGLKVGAAADDSSWGKTDHCSFLACDKGIAFMGAANYSHLIEGGSIGYGDDQTGIYSESVGNSKITGVKFDTNSGQGLRSIGIDISSGNNTLITQCSFEIDLAVTAAIRLGHVAQSIGGSIVGCGFQHNTPLAGKAIVIEGVGTAFDTRSKGIQLIGNTFNGWDTAIDLSNAWGVNIIGGSIYQGGTTGVKIASTCTGTRIIGFNHPGTGTMTTFINDAGTGTVVSWCADHGPSDTGVATRQGVGTTHEAAGTPTGGYSGEIRLGNGKIWVNDAGTWKSVAVA